MKIRVDFSELGRLARMIGDGSAEFRLNNRMGAFEGFDIDETLAGEGIEIDLESIDTDFNLLSYHGRQVLLYIKDHRAAFDAAVADPEGGRRFHIAHCTKLEEMRNSGAFNERYVATNNVSGAFEITDERPGLGERKARVELMVCRYCLQKLNYRGATNYDARQKAFRDFSLKEFFSDYSSCFLYMPKAWSENTSLGYTSDWAEISRELREKAGYTCSSCHVDLSTHQRLCHAHHINRVKTDNRPENLQVLCKDCHRRQPYHEGIFVSHSEMQIITALRRKSGVLDRSDWDEAFELADPAVHGDLDLLKRKGYRAPVIGHEVQGPDGEVVVEIEAAWPELHQGIAIENLQVPGWKIWQVGDICAG
ncbi:TPA: HNH endonuclease [Pseudomonas aeruginosa]|nr:HNH endonuclease [Pseudomonas aeruginosa]